jgi:large subunit ribosomal protein L18
MYAQLIDDAKGLTIAAASSMGVKGNKTEAASKVGSELAKLAKAKGVTKVVFDRGGFIYTGRVRALADAAREGGLEF